MQFFGIGFLVLLFLEIMSVVWVADWLGGGGALFLMIVSFVGGMMMLRHTGISGLLLAGAAVRSGQEISLYQMLWPVRYAVAALLRPGFVSTVFALLLLLPLKGRPIADTDAGNSAVFGRTAPFSRQDEGGDIIEGEYTVTSGNAQNPKQEYIEHKPD